MFFKRATSQRNTSLEVGGYFLTGLYFSQRLSFLVECFSNGMGVDRFNSFRTKSPFKTKSPAFQKAQSGQVYSSTCFSISL